VKNSNLNRKWQSGYQVNMILGIKLYGAMGQNAPSHKQSFSLIPL
jgi:hypothetical protein